MKPFYKIKYLFFRLTSFLLLLLFFGKARAQDAHALYGVEPVDPSPAERIFEITNRLVGVAILVVLVIIPVIGFRWLVLKKKANKKLLYALAIIIFIILEKIIVFFAINP